MAIMLRSWLYVCLVLFLPALILAQIIPPPPPKDRPIKFMVVGDSISHGMQADSTWRYRIWDFLKTRGYQPDFVGPWTGTNGPPRPVDLRPYPPPLAGEIAHSGQNTIGWYNREVPTEFVSTSHASFSGRQVNQTKDTIHDWVVQYQPEYILMLLGFNDLGWWVSNATGLVVNMGILISNARLAKPNVKFLIANVIDRTFGPGREDLINNTATYNTLLSSIYLGDWFRHESPIGLVDLHAAYQCTPHDGCPDAHDGLHPNAMGEYHIAEAFATMLQGFYHFEGEPFVAPSSVPPRDVLIPTSFQILAVDEGILVKWDMDSQARSYGLLARQVGQSDWAYNVTIPGNEFYITELSTGQTWEAQAQSISDPGIVSEWTSLVNVTAYPKFAPAPPDILTASSGNDNVQVVWSPTPGYDVDRYVVTLQDRDTPGDYPAEYATRNTMYLAAELKAGHRYSIWVDTWINRTDGLVGGASTQGLDVIAGGGSPLPPTGLQATNQNSTVATISWTPSNNSSQYSIYMRQLVNQTYTNVATTTDPTHDFDALTSGTWKYEFCVSAWNGDIESKMADACIIPIKSKKSIAPQTRSLCESAYACLAFYSLLWTSASFLLL